ncbi:MULTISPECIES: SDR family oxidoreductase [unclassified Mycobacterium]|uniref:SDR family oxidoreductase n=1 Tax=unclassified Mycobacterium TaxID=2642494 RepID=UPI0029C8876E|nr:MULTISPECIES: SDR family oxidoreductase [unclassified Mycobacterium]
MEPTPERIILVTGASVGIGAAVAQQLADENTHVIVNFHEDEEGAEAVAEAIREAGGHASTLSADITDEAEAFAMVDSIATRLGRLDAVILNASGASMRLNSDAQRRLARLTMPLMPSGGHVVFVTSHQAHFFPNKAVPKGYAAVAASKRAGETALHAMHSEFNRAGVSFTVVSGELSDDTITIDTRRTHGSPTTVEFAGAVVSAASTLHPSSVVFVGGPHYLMAA